MATTLSGWICVDKGAKSGDLAHYKEVYTFGTGATDVYGSEFGRGITGTTGTPRPPAGVDFTVMFLQNNTMSAAGDIVLRGSTASGGTFALLKDDLIAYAAASSAAGQATAARVDLSAYRSSPTCAEMPVYKLHLDADAAHSATTGTDKTAEVHVMWIQP